jgi:YidC/Oxa1 family membrane protein insertase
VVQTDFSSNSTVYDSDLVITDWSSIALEFSLTTKKPSLFINTPMKVMNPEWRKIEVEPLDIWLRDRIGVSLDTDKLEKTKETVQNLLDNRDDYKSAILDFMTEHLYNVGCTAEAGGAYIIGQVNSRRKHEPET